MYVNYKKPYFKPFLCHLVLLQYMYMYISIDTSYKHVFSFILYMYMYWKLSYNKAIIEKVSSFFEAPFLPGKKVQSWH